MKVPKRHQLLLTGEPHIVVAKTVNKMEGLLAACGAPVLFIHLRCIKTYCE